MLDNMKGEKKNNNLVYTSSKMAGLVFFPLYLKGRGCSTTEDTVTPKKEFQVFPLEGARTQWPVAEFKECSNKSFNITFESGFLNPCLIGFPIIVIDFLLTFIPNFQNSLIYIISHTWRLAPHLNYI